MVQPSRIAIDIEFCAEASFYLDRHVESLHTPRIADHYVGERGKDMFISKDWHVCFL